MATKTFNPKTNIYTSPRPVISIPTDPNLSLTSFLFHSTAAAAASSVALIDADSSETLTFHELKTRVSKLAHALSTEFHVSKHDVVLIFAPNSIRFPVAFLAVVSLGAIATTCNPSYTINELTKQVSDCKPKLAITVPQLLHKVKRLNLPSLLLNKSTTTTMTTTSKTLRYYDDLIEKSIEWSSTEFPGSNDVTQNDVAALLYSSGTTGTGKGVILTHRNFIAASLMVTCDQDRYCQKRKFKNLFYYIARFSNCRIGASNITVLTNTYYNLFYYNNMRFSMCIRSQI